LIPKKSKVIVEITAKEMEKDINLVRDITSFYWETIRKNLSGLVSPVIKINGLGTMNIRPIKLVRAVTDYNAILKYITPKHYQSFAKIKDLESKLERLNKMTVLFDETKIKRANIKTKRDEQDKKNLE
jgi:hypothetical protein